MGTTGRKHGAAWWSSEWGRGQPKAVTTEGHRVKAPELQGQVGEQTNARKEGDLQLRNLFTFL